jgi:hypothetical protein
MRPEVYSDAAAQPINQPLDLLPVKLFGNYGAVLISSVTWGIFLRLSGLI